MHRFAVRAAMVLLLVLRSVPLIGQATPAEPKPQGHALVTLQPGDVVKVTIWREPDLSGDFPVDATGVVTLPLLGDQQVTGIPMADLRDVFVEQYRIHLRNPSITIIPLRRVNVYGEVNRPGLYSVDPTISLAGLVTLAGGRTGNGDLDRIRIIRDGTVVQDRVGTTTSLNSIDVRSGDQIVVGQRSWLARNLGLVLSIPSTIAGVIGLFNLIR